METHNRPASGISAFAKTPHGLIDLALPLLTQPPAVGPVPDGGRRPVVALLDSQVQPHWWFDTPWGPWWSTLDAFETSAVSGAERGIVALPETEMYPGDDSLAAFREHGTFNAGLVRQLAPNAAVLSVPVMNSQGDIAHETVLEALTRLRDRVSGQDPTTFVDVMCLPFGYRGGTEPDGHQDAERGLLHDLAERGVHVVAAAGNSGTTDPTFPAAFAAEGASAALAVISVGAKDPSGGPAAYSNHGTWVTHWERGTDVESIVAEPANGFARGRGTSFAAARFAGKLADALSRDMRALADVSPAAAIARAEWALGQLPEQMPA